MSPSSAVQRRLCLAVGMLLLAVSLGCGHGAEKPTGPRIESLKLEGVHHVSKGDIQARIATVPTGWWPFATRRDFDPITWESDLARIERYYESRGYYDAEIVSSSVKPLGDRGVALTAVVSEGGPTRVGTVRIEGLDPPGGAGAGAEVAAAGVTATATGLTPAERADVERHLRLAPGDVFVEDRWEAAKTALRARLRGLGFADAAVDGRALVDVKAHTAALLLVVQLGPRYRFGDIEVRLGPRAALAPVWVWEQVRLAAPEGSLFSDEALAEAQRRVFGMGLFAVAKVSTGTPDRARARMPIVVEAREAPFHTLRAGGGVRIDQIRNEARLVLEWSDRNFHGGMRKLTAHAEAGWAFIPSTYAVLSNDVAAGPRSGPIARLRLELEQPRLLEHPALRLRSSIELERTLEQAYDALGGRFATGVVWQPRASLSVYPTYNLQAYWLNGPAIASASAAPLTLGCADTTSSCLIVLSYLEQMVTWDRRDSPLEARNGFYASLSLQEGGGPLLGDFTYVRVLPDLRGYVSLGEHDRLTFAARLRVGELLPGGGGQSAVVTRFFAGGGISMRGFSDRRLSPLLLAPAPSTQLTPGGPALLTLPIGGDGLIDGSFEARLQLSSALVLAVFSDFGQVTQGRIGPDDLSSLLWAVGIGLRYRTPVGPIRVDFARRLQVGRPPPLYAVNPIGGGIAQMPYTVDDSCFGLGGTHRGTFVNDNLCVLHIAIGEAF